MKLSFDLSSDSVPAELKAYITARKPQTAILQSLAIFGSQLPDLELRLGQELANSPARTSNSAGKRLIIDDSSELGGLILSLHRRLRLSSSHVFELLYVIYWKSSRPAAATAAAAISAQIAQEPAPLTVPVRLPSEFPQEQPSLRSTSLSPPIAKQPTAVSGEPQRSSVSDIFSEFLSPDCDFLKEA